MARERKPCTTADDRPFTDRSEGEKLGEGMIKEGSDKWNGSLKRWYLIPHHLETALGLPTSVWAFIRAKPSVKPEC